MQSGTQMAKIEIYKSKDSILASLILGAIILIHYLVWVFHVDPLPSTDGADFYFQFESFLEELRLPVSPLQSFEGWIQAAGDLPPLMNLLPTGLHFLGLNDLFLILTIYYDVKHIQS